MKIKERKGMFMIIGITGSSGSGKSTLCEILENAYNVKVLNADKIARRLSRKGTSYLIDIIKVFGKDIVDEEGELKRSKLAQIIYSDAKKREELNTYTFKYVKEDIIKKISKIQEGTTIVIDAPLLFEAELDKMCDKVIGIIAPREMQIERIVARDDIDYEDAEKRLVAQANDEFFIKKCDYIIKNDNGFSKIEEQINDICNKIGIEKKS